MAVIGELRFVEADVDVFAERGGGGGCMKGATVEALRFVDGGLSFSLNRGETGLGAVVDGARELLIVEVA